MTKNAYLSKLYNMLRWNFHPKYIENTINDYFEFFDEKEDASCTATDLQPYKDVANDILISKGSKTYNIIIKYIRVITVFLLVFLFPIITNNLLNTAFIMSAAASIPFEFVYIFFAPIIIYMFSGGIPSKLHNNLAFLLVEEIISTILFSILLYIYFIIVNSQKTFCFISESASNNENFVIIINAIFLFMILKSISWFVKILNASKLGCISHISSFIDASYMSISYFLLKLSVNEQMSQNGNYLSLPIKYILLSILVAIIGIVFAIIYIKKMQKNKANYMY